MRSADDDDDDDGPAATGGAATGAARSAAAASGRASVARAEAVRACYMDVACAPFDVIWLGAQALGLREHAPTDAAEALVVDWLSADPPPRTLTAERRLRLLRLLVLRLLPPGAARRACIDARERRALDAFVWACGLAECRAPMRAPRPVRLPVAAGRLLSCVRLSVEITSTLCVLHYRSLCVQAGFPAFS